MVSMPMMGSVRPSGRSLPSVTITFPSAIVYTVAPENSARAQLGSNYSRGYFSFTQSGNLIARDFLHEGSGANCTTWNTALAAATRAQISLTAGAKTGIEIATAVESSLTGAGVTGVVRTGAQIRINNASGLNIGAPNVSTEALKGMWGRQKVNCGDAPTFSPVNGTPSAHITTPATAGRIIGLYISGSNGARTGSMRMGIADGPAYNVAPTAFSNGQEGLVTRNGEHAVLIFAEPLTMAAAVDKYITWRTNTAAAWGVETRPHASSPVARGDLTVSERVLINTTITNPATPIYTAGAYTHTNSATGQAYAAVGFIYELPTGGAYQGDAGIDTWLGYHGAYNAGTPSTDIGPTTLDGLSDTPRFPVPWTDMRLTELRQGCNAIAATEDFGFGIYDCSASTPTVYPMSPAPTLLRSIGRANASTGAGYKNVVVSPAIDLTGVTRVGLGSCAGNIDGSIPATTVTIVYTPPGTGTVWNAGDDGSDGRAWDDALAERGGLGVDFQYIAQAAGNNPHGAPANAWPATLDTDATDATFNNHPRIALRLQRAGMVAA